MVKTEELKVFTIQTDFPQDIFIGILVCFGAVIVYIPAEPSRWLQRCSAGGCVRQVQGAVPQGQIQGDKTNDATEQADSEK
ncbi:hypothetical protein [Enterobacter asburiae]|uniref:hypothetical protein n=1 Tax=Enterobacter asburiae TaxID=61645 RepID=UPI001E33D6CB|nr:hypothetical protein [Enterobacter asburiae]MCE2004232.1 hypothetical protein [Enterobacter asburiae]